MKKWTKAFVLSLAALQVAPLFACGKSKASNTPETLEIYIGNFGYGTEWLDEIIASFKEEDWVKEKYPNLNIPKPKTNAMETYVEDTINSEVTTIDLFFSTRSAAPSFNKRGNNGKSLYENLTDLYESTIPGETVTFEQKMDDTIVSQYKMNVTGLGTGYYAMPWVKGYLGLLYNQKVMDKLGASYKLPNTTDELVKLCEDLKAIGEKAFVFNAGYDYPYTMTMNWWAQYQGLEEYSNYWNGTVNGEFSTDIFKQQGRLESLKVMEALYGKGSDDAGKYYDEKVNSWTFTQAQTQFLSGAGAMQVNGDWFENETAAKAESGNTDADISFMKVPVISAIIARCTSISDDSTLSKVIDAIDSGATEYAGVTAEDFARIKEARKTVNLVEGHDAYIPSYSSSVALAKDFLLYMASDKSIQTFTSNTRGAVMPFEYDFATQSPALYEGLSKMQKAKLDIFKDAKIMPMATLREFSYYGGLSAYSQTKNLTTAFTAPNKADRKTAQQIYDAEIKFYTDSDEEMFKQILTKMGLK